MARGVGHVVVRQEVSMVSIVHVARHHCRGILISDGILSSLHLLFFDEFIVSTRAVLDIRIIAVVAFVFLCLVPNKNYIALVDGSLVGTAV